MHNWDMQLSIPKISCDLAKLNVLNQHFVYKRVLEALKSESEAGFELSVKTLICP